MNRDGQGIVVGVDIGGTWVEAVVTDELHRVTGRHKRATDVEGADGVLASASAAIRGAVEASETEIAGLGGIGIGVPGHVDAETGVVTLATNLNIDEPGLAIGPRVEHEFGAPVVVENDVRAAALGAYDFLFHDGSDLRTLAYLSIGTGISAGVVVDGRLHRGRNGLAGEIGHVVVVDDGPPCRCGLNGCLEAVAAGPAISRMWPGGTSPVEDLLRAAGRGDPEAVRIADEMSNHLTRAIQWLATAVGADLIALGGGVGSIGGPLLAAIRARLSRMADRSDVARRTLPPERVVAMSPRYPTGALGAAALARQRLSGSGGTTDAGKGEMP
jgi:glucokinase